MNPYRKYGYKRVDRGEIAYTYKIIELGVKDSDPFPRLGIPLDPQKIAHALNVVYELGREDMAKTIEEDKELLG